MAGRARRGPCSCAPAGNVALADGVAAAATVRIVGTIHGRSFVLPKAEVAAAIEALRRDVVRSLKARVPLLLEQLQEEREDEEEETAADA